MIYLATLLMLGVLATSCNKIESQDPTPDDNTQVVAQVEMAFTATMAAKYAGTKAVDADGVTTWVVNEKIAVYYQKNDDTYGTATANVDAVNAGVATISASLTNAKNGGIVKFVYPASLVNASGDDIDVAKLESNQHGTIADISTNFDAATGSGTLVTDGSTCGTEATITLTNRVLIGRFTPKFGGAAINEITTLTVSDGTNSYTVTPSAGTFGTSGIYVAMLPVSSQVVSLIASTASANYIYSGKSVTLVAGKLYNNLAIEFSVPAYYSATTNDVGKVIGNDGNMYVNVDAATAAGTTAVAMIAYVGAANTSSGTHGLALALADEPGKMSWGNARTACEAKAAFQGNSWRLPTYYDWQHMFICCSGRNDTVVENNAQPSFSSSINFSELQTKLTNAGGATLTSDCYWLDTMRDAGTAWFADMSHNGFGSANTSTNYYVRAVLMF